MEERSGGKARKGALEVRTIRRRWEWNGRVEKQREEGGIEGRRGIDGRRGRRGAQRAEKEVTHSAEAAACVSTRGRAEGSTQEGAE